MELSISEKLAYSTIRIECNYNDGNFGTGTGFFFSLLVDKENDSHVPVIITNKHVVRGANQGQLIFTKATDNNMPNDREHYSASFYDFESLWLEHPDSKVDLCFMPFAQVVNDAKSKEIKLYFATLDMSLLPTEERLSEISSIEEILMVGYPNGIWDAVNNKPIFRRGITATNPVLDYNGKKEFMIDIACFPGSSGSPIFILNRGSYTDKKENIHVGKSRLILMGILYAGPQHTTTGEVRIIDVQTVQKPISISTIPNNLGLVIKSERIRELEKLFKDIVRN